jgi:hypothetical protein
VAAEEMEVREKKGGRHYILGKKFSKEMAGVFLSGKTKIERLNKNYFGKNQIV